MRQGEKSKIVKALYDTGKYKLNYLLRSFDLPKSTYFRNIKSEGKVAKRNEELTKTIHEVFQENNGRFGVIRICNEIRKQGQIVNHKVVQSIMNIEGLEGKHPKEKYHSYGGVENRTVPNLICRNFLADAPMLKITTDVSQFKFSWGKCFIAITIDMFNNEVLSWNLSLSPNMEQQKQMLKGLFKKIDEYRSIIGCSQEIIFHSDQGWQYQSPQYKKMLKEKGITQSMSRKGNCYDNSIMESFFGRLKNEMFYGEESKYHNFEEFSKAISEYIDYYNNRRIQKKTHWLPPTEYKNQYLRGKIS